MRRWGLAHYLAVGGLLAVAWQTWGYAAWLVDGPYQITKFRDVSSTNWWVVRVFEAVAVVVGIGVLAYVVRDCRREGRLTIDAKICIAGASSMFFDPLINFFQPVWFYSSNFVNLNAWCGHAPFIVNPDCGRLPEPVLFAFVGYAFGLLVGAILIGKAMSAVKRQRPAISRPRLILFAFGLGCLFDLLLESIALPFHLWAYPGSPDWFSLFGHGKSYRYTFFLMIADGLIFATVAALRYFRDDRGRTVADRGLEGLSPRAATSVSVLAYCGVVCTILFLAAMLTAAAGPYSSQYVKMPAYLVNGLCDTPGTTGTAYGPCPGSPGYRMPVRRLLGDESP